ncbi:COP23 domain-containing protein [Nostoc sp. NMS8]|uniref:COP23 domain-containing protein n=1 Tax=Nostoc sp. NMS8 TaxID=2815392 RepID=UPI0025EDA8F2|nr:COP23 domain-containing protein [Nostoc sp. NMS8]MBN3957440.1 hypothetical protein [Nostoc sp. NMS8]
MYHQIQVLVSTFVFSGLIATSVGAANSAPQTGRLAGIPSIRGNSNSIEKPSRTPTSTVFRCVSQGSGYATVAQRGTKQATLIAWNTTYFGPEYTPEQRCQMVSSKVTQAVATNGGSLANLMLTNGPVNGQMVICYLNGGATSCNSANMLFTLKLENAKRAADILQTLKTFGQFGTGTIYESAGDQVYVSIEEWANHNLGSEVEAVPQENNSPSLQPETVPGPAF